MYFGGVFCIFCTTQSFYKCRVIGGVSFQLAHAPEQGSCRNSWSYNEDRQLKQGSCYGSLARPGLSEPEIFLFFHIPYWGMESNSKDLDVSNQITKSHQQSELIPYVFESPYSASCLPNDYQTLLRHPHFLHMQESLCHWNAAWSKIVASQAGRAW